MLSTLNHTTPCLSVVTKGALGASRNAMAASSRHFAGKASPSGGEWQTMDGCTAVCHSSYAMMDTAFIYPITPSSPAAELAEQWSALGVKNAFGDVPKITQMQSEAGASGALHGALAAGSLATTYTASQGLLLMVPNMYKIAGELLPCVMHVAARALAGQALSIFGDHQDVMAVRQTGFAMIDANTVQECHDMALISHLATLRARVPFVSFFDGFRLSHNIEKVDTLPYNQMRRMVDMKALNAHRARALNPNRPYVRGTNENPDVYFQQFEASNAFYDKTPKIVQEEMDRVGAVTGRHYDLFQWTGPKDAEAAIVVLGSGASVVEEALPYINAQGKKVGVLKPRLYRPWSSEDFLKSLPKTVKRIAVLDRTKEPGSLGEPLYLDVASTIQESDRTNIKVIGGRWGLGQKDFTPRCVAAVADNLYSQYPKDHFTVGIDDDVTNRSLPLNEELNVSHPKTVECLIYGYGSDGTVGANKNATKIIGDNTDLFVQAYFAYGSQKAGGLTMSHLRFGPEPIKSYYAVNKADYVGCHNPTYLDMYRMTDHLKEGGTFCLNSPFTTVEEWNKHVPAGVRKALAEKNAKVFNVDAFKVAEECGMGRMINVVMQSAFFKLANVMDFKECIQLYKNTIRKSYGHRGEAVVQKNYNMIDKALDAITQIDVPAEWKNLSDGMLHYEQTYHNAIGALANEKSAINRSDFTKNVQAPIALLHGDEIPVSAFANDQIVGGKVPLGTAKTEKRGVALSVPVVDMDKCTQCNTCAMSCPHAVIRPFLLSQAEVDSKPATFETRKAKGGAEVAGLHYRIQVSPLDCTGCEVCVNACPDDALTMKHLADVSKAESPNWEYAMGLPDRSSRFDTTSLKGSQFHQPLLEFHGACAGCGETPYVRLLTQMFGDRMMIANATGCSSIWGAPYGSTPYTTRPDGTGPAWANSLFEDAAEYGMGMAVTTAVRRNALKARVQELLLEGKDSPLSPELYTQLNEWVENFRNPAVCEALSKSLPSLLKAEASKDPAIQEILDASDLLPKISNWIIGGDGWSYDIGYGGLDHVIASGQDLNVLVLDTEAYSNTGGQKSKSTPIGAVAKFATKGHDVEKKNLAEMAIDYGTVYVASVSMGANYQQTLKAFSEAEAYDGCSLVVAYAPCIEHKNLDGMSHTMQHQATVAASGYFPLYRYNPMLTKMGKNPFVLDTKRITKSMDTVIKNEMRFGALKKRDADLYNQYTSQLTNWVHERYSKYQRWAALGPENISDGVPLTLLYGTETGTAEALSYRVAELARQRGYAVKVMQCDEMDVSELPDNKNLMVLCSTTGEGETPRTALDFTSQLQSAAKDSSNAHLLDGVQFGVFALGDSSYHHFCTAGKRIDELIAEMGGQRTVSVGLGNDQDDDKYETAFEDWMPSYWKSVNAPEPVDDGSIPDSQFEVRELDSDEAVVAPYERIMPPHTIQLGLKKNDRLTPSDYERDIRHLRFELDDGQDLPYLLGDVLNIHPMNEAGRVGAFLQSYGLNPKEMIKITPVSENIDARKRAAALRPRTISQLFEESLDIFGRPNRAFYKSLSKFAEDPKEKAELAMIGNPDDTKGRDLYTKLATETVTFADVLNKYTSARPSLDQLITLIPCTKPRLYSIASSPRFVGPKAIELAVVIVNWTTPSGVRRTGTATDYIQRIAPGHKTTATVTSGSFKFPESPMTPMIMAGLGTGLAPFRAFSQERAWMKRQGIQTGPMWLFYGCRHQNKDYIFGNELEGFVKEGAITELHPAFSRDQKEKVYVQNKIDENSARVYEDLIKKGGYFYLCGQAGQVENDIRSAVYRAIAKGENVSMEKAKAIFEDLADNDRYCPEVY